MSKLSRCPKFCSKNIQILLMHSNSRWTKENIVATDFHVFSAIFESSKCLKYLVVYSGICKNIFQNPIKKWRRRNQPNLFSAAFSINSISFKEKEVLLPQYIISSLNPFKMCPVLHTGTDKDQNLMNGWRHFSKKRKLYYTNGGNHHFIIFFRYFS